jgi:hypothetical protein
VKPLFPQIANPHQLPPAVPPRPSSGRSSGGNHQGGRCNEQDNMCVVPLNWGARECYSSNSVRTCCNDCIVCFGCGTEDFRRFASAAQEVQTFQSSSKRSWENDVDSKLTLPDVLCCS